MGIIQRLLAAVVLAASALAVSGSSPAFAERRVALIVGNGAYKHSTALPNPANDARDVAAALARVGFETILGVDLDKAAMDEHAIRFARAARGADVAVFYYSGHAMQFAGVNYLMPVDASLRDEADLRRMSRVDDILVDLQQAKNLRILVLDSCRDNPLAEDLKRSIGLTRAAGLQRGLAKIDSPHGMIVAYATQAGRTADDGSGRNSPYTTAFLKHIEAQDEIGTVFRRVSADVYAATREAQLPELSLSLIGEFYLNGKRQAATSAATAPSAQTPARPDPCAAAEAHWKSAETINTQAAYDDHLARFPNCPFAGLARARVAALAPPAAAPAQRAATDLPATAPATGQSAHARGFFSEQDAQRVTALGAKHKYPVPEYKMEVPSADVPAALRNFVGVWASETGFAGGRGRQAMLIVTAVDSAGRASGFYIWGPPTSNSFEQTPASLTQFDGKIEEGKLAFSRPKFSNAITFTTNDRLFLSNRWHDGRTTAIVLLPVWRLVAAERTAAARAPSDDPSKPAAPRLRTFKQEPQGGVGALTFGEKALVDDGTCPAGQIKEITGGNRNTPRARRCIPRE